jgi:hypothetical protein
MDMLRGGFMPGLLGNGQGTVGAGSSYDAATEAIAAAFTTPPTTARKNLIDAAVVALKSAGVWAKLDALYAFAAADSQAALINWKAPGTFNGTNVNACVFTADQGFAGGSTKSIGTGFNPTTAPSPKLVQDSGTLFGWSYSNPSSAGSILSNGAGSTGLIIAPRYGGGTRYVAVNDVWTLPAAPSDATGLTATSRTSSSLRTVYLNAVSAETTAVASNAIINAALMFLQGAGNYFTEICCGGGFGSGLTGTEHTALYNALRTYMTGVGVP